MRAIDFCHLSRNYNFRQVIQQFAPTSDPQQKKEILEELGKAVQIDFKQAKVQLSDLLQDKGSFVSQLLESVPSEKAICLYQQPWEEGEQ
mmetsp:Transcript_8849/g.15013  ORF Transcript_8849/g.15013 Transcript_8849/m.15013 type:complete len:90 (+) Transcript_8849:1954-2223(+)